MSKKNPDKKINIIIPLCIIFSILYVIFSISRLTTELNFISVWTVDSSVVKTELSKTSLQSNMEENIDSADSNSEVKNDSSEEYRFPFISGQNLGYFNDKGEIIFVKTFPFKATITKDAYCIYGTNDEKMKIFNSKDDNFGVINKSGFPYFLEDMKFLFLPGGTSFSLLSSEENSTGEVLWTYEGYSPITAFSCSKGGIIAGTSDGTILVFDKNGTIIQNFIPGGSEYPVILGCDISNDGKYIACLTGQNRQRFIIAHEKKGHWEIIFHKHLKSSVNYQTVVKFDEESNTVYYDYKDALGIINLKNLKESNIPIEGRIMDIKQSEKFDFNYILSKKNGTYTVSILEPFDSIAGEFSFEAKTAFIEVKDNMLFVGRDDEISRIDVERK